MYGLGSPTFWVLTLDLRDGKYERSLLCRRHMEGNPLQKTHSRTLPCIVHSNSGHLFDVEFTYMLAYQNPCKLWKKTYNAKIETAILRLPRKVKSVHPSFLFGSWPLLRV